MTVAIIDYGMGNLGSVQRALAAIGGEEARVIADPAQLRFASRMILPGVGSFAEAMGNLVQRGWKEEIRRQVHNEGKPLLGICLGMQLLASHGTEHGETEGLDLVAGTVVPLESLGCLQRVPHVGWNEITNIRNHPLFSAIPTGTDFYFVHSFAFKVANPDSILAVSDYGVPLAAAVQHGNSMGVQYHPEKSAKAGFRQLRNFLDLKPC